jgi:uncharacterized protein DUF3592
VAAAIFLVVLSCGVIVTGANYARAARRMRSFRVTRGRVIAREVAVVPSKNTREARWGKGGGYWPKATYTYNVDGVSYTSDRKGYAFRGLKHSVAVQALAAIPDEVDVHYDPAAPQIAYLETHRPAFGNALLGGGAVGLLVGLVVLLG